MRRFLDKILKKAGLLNRNRDVIESKIRKDVQVIPIQPNLELEVYWKVLDIGKGPAVILKAFEKEIMKFDFFGKDRGHYHISPNFNFRIYFHEETVLKQIRRAWIELQENAQKYISIQSDDRIKNSRIDKEKLSEAVQKADAKLTCFLENVPELKELR